MHIFCLETQPVLTPCSSVPLAERPPPAAQRFLWLGPRSIPPQPHVQRQKNLLLAGISSWVHTYQSMRHRDPVQRAILPRNLWKLPGIQFNKFSPHYIIYWNKIPRAVNGFLVMENCKWLGLYFKFCYLSKALVCVALLNEWSLPDLWLDYNSPFWWVFY